jgi:hypothetical protein
MRRMAIANQQPEPTDDTPPPSKPKAKAEKQATKTVPLKWKDKRSGDGYYLCEAKAAKGKYRVDPTHTMLSGMSMAFVGYHVLHHPTGKFDDGRNIAEHIMDLDKAKAMAQTDHDAGKDQ